MKIYDRADFLVYYYPGMLQMIIHDTDHDTVVDCNLSITQWRHLNRAIEDAHAAGYKED